MCYLRTARAMWERERVRLDTVQDLLIQLDMKKCIYIVEIRSYSLSKWCYRQTYQSYEQIKQELGTFSESKVIKRIQYFFNKNCSPCPVFSKEFFFGKIQFSTLKNDLGNQNFEMFDEVVHNFCKSENLEWYLRESILVTLCLYHSRRQPHYASSAC